MDLPDARPPGFLLAIFIVVDEQASRNMTSKPSMISNLVVHQITHTPGPASRSFNNSTRIFADTWHIGPAHQESKSHYRQYFLAINHEAIGNMLVPMEDNIVPHGVKYNKQVVGSLPVEHSGFLMPLKRGCL